MRIFVTDGDQRSTLAVVRSLGSNGIEVVVGHSLKQSLAASSRLCHRAKRYPSPWVLPEEFQEFILRQMRTGKYHAVLAMTDVTTQLLAAIEARLPSGVQLLSASSELIERVQNKAQVLAVAKKAGVPCPESFFPRDAHELRALADSFEYPLVIKPRFSRYWTGKCWERGLVCYASSCEDLVAKYRQVHSTIPNPIVQRHVRGRGRAVFLLMWKGQVKAAFAHRRLREHPHTGGVSVLCESVPMDKRLLEQSTTLLRTLEWNGPAMVEFKDDQSDGVPKLMEVNGRFWGSLQLATDAGVNFPLLLCRLAAGEDVPAQTTYRTGVRFRWLCGDLRQIGRRLSEAAASHKLRPALAHVLGEVGPLVGRGLRYEEFRWSDPKPGFFQFRELAGQAVGQWMHLAHDATFRFKVRGRSNYECSTASTYGVCASDSSPGLSSHRLPEKPAGVSSTIRDDESSVYPDTA
jgi:predicted ATP-grasp superfamily ATP-dependent carboligase